VLRVVGDVRRFSSSHPFNGTTNPPRKLIPTPSLRLGSRSGLKTRHQPNDLLIGCDHHLRTSSKWRPTFLRRHHGFGSVNLVPPSSAICIICPAYCDKETVVSSAIVASSSRERCAPPSFIQRSIAASLMSQARDARSAAEGGTLTVSIMHKFTTAVRSAQT